MLGAKSIESYWKNLKRSNGYRKIMNLHYDSPENKIISWFVEEIASGSRYKLLDGEGNPLTLPVTLDSNGIKQFNFYDGFIVEGNDVYAVSLLSGAPKTLVGHNPRIC